MFNQDSKKCMHTTECVRVHKRQRETVEERASQGTKSDKYIKIVQPKSLITK